MAGGCAFCRIVRGDAAAHVVLDSGDVLAFLDHRPLFPGHCLLVPRTHWETLADAPADAMGALFSHVRRLTRALPLALGAAGTFVAVNNRVSQSVPHVHVHVVPRNPKDGLRGFFWPRQSYRDGSHMDGVRDAIVAALAREPS